MVWYESYIFKLYDVVNWETNNASRSKGKGNQTMRITQLTGT